MRCNFRELISDRAGCEDGGAPLFFADSHMISQLLESILSDHQLLDRTALFSCRHVLGFDKIVLSPEGYDGSVIRLHVWWPDEPSNLPDVHNHGRDFVARLLAGSYVQEHWIVDQGGTAHYKFSYGMDSGQNSSRLLPAGTERISCIKRETFRSGDVYELASSSLHRIISEPGVFTCSIVVQGPRKSVYSSVYSSSWKSETGERSVELISATDLRRKLCVVRDYLRES